MKLQDLFEAKIGGSKADAAMSAMISYLQKKLGVEFIKLPGMEVFSNSKHSGVGFRYVVKGSMKSIRFNWKSAPQAGKANEITSIDYWNGTSHDPALTIKPEGVSLVKVLPNLAKILSAPKTGNVKVFPISGKLEESIIQEAKRGDFTAEQALTDFFKKLESGSTFTRSDFIGAYHVENAGLFDTLFNVFKDDFDIQGKRITGVVDGADVNKLKAEIIKEGGNLSITTGGTGETYEPTPGEQEIMERIPFTETLDHLEGLVTGLVKGAFNALFVAGKGGTGKTQTVEDTLHSMGLRDGDGYFKNTGSASAIGVYSLLYQHRNEIILFDDSDGALADQDARNIIKAATDTKKSRKLVWNKKSSFIFDPEEMDPEEVDDPSMVPKYFDFKGRIIFISNLPLAKLDPDGALRTRAFVISVDPTDQELFERMAEILHDIKLEDGLTLSKGERENVMEVVKTSKRKGDVSLRKLVRALNLAASGAPNWEKLVSLYA